MKLVDVVGKFHGAGDVEQWLDKYELSLKITSTAADEAALKKEMVQLLPLFLADGAYATWKGLSESEKEDFETVKSALRRVFGKSKLSAWAELKSLQFSLENRLTS